MFLPSSSVFSSTKQPQPGQNLVCVSGLSVCPGGAWTKNTGDDAMLCGGNGAGEPHGDATEFSLFEQRPNQSSHRARENPQRRLSVCQNRHQSSHNRANVCQSSHNKTPPVVGCACMCAAFSCGATRMMDHLMRLDCSLLGMGSRQQQTAPTQTPSHRAWDDDGFGGVCGVCQSQHTPIGVCFPRKDSRC